MKDKIFKANSETLIYDIETKVDRSRKDINSDQLKLFGYYSYKYNEFGIATDLDDIQEIIKDHKILVGFYNKEYDNIVLRNHGITMEYKIIIDLYYVIKKRATQIKTKKGILSSLLMKESLDYITRLLDLVDDDNAKMKLDEGWFYDWKEEHMKTIKEYTIRDIEITKKLYEWSEEYFWSFRDYIKDEDVRKKSYLKDSLTKVGVKAICKALNWEERYNYDVEHTGEKISGGFSSYPSIEKVINKKIYQYDFNSLYTWGILQCNLHGRVLDGNPNNRPTFKSSDKLKFFGEYYADEMSEVSKLFIGWYEQRLQYKKEKNSKEYCLKIFLNIAVYGALDSPWYSNVYDKIAANDCTTICRQFTILSRKRFVEAGYQLLYSDTDSDYIVDPFDDIARMDKVKDAMIAEIKTLLPFPSDYFDMKREEPIRSIFFFKGNKTTNESPLDEYDKENKKLGLMKKNYIYVQTDGKLVVKNLGIVKKSTSKLTKKIFWEYLVPQIKKDNIIKFKKSYITNLVESEIKEDIEIVAVRKNVKNIEAYENSMTGIQAQLSKAYGMGIHFIMINNKFGVGKKKRYCLLSEFKEKKLGLSDLILSNIYRELSYFTEQKPINTLLSYMN